MARLCAGRSIDLITNSAEFKRHEFIQIKRSVTDMAQIPQKKQG
jgi:hypothetical protein